MLNIIKDYVNKNEHFTRKTPIPQEKLLYLVNLVLTNTWYTSYFQFYQHTNNNALGGVASSTTAEIYMQAHERTPNSTTLPPLPRKV